MRMVDLIEKKRDGNKLTNKEISFIIQEYNNDNIPDYQMSSLLMAIYFQGMTHDESVALTKEMLHSGDTINLSMIKGVTVDKHSTGGVGDKTTLVLAPLVASVGASVAKLSGRGLGHTGGTLDKLESIPNMNISIDIDAFKTQVQEIGIAVAGQTANLTPADKKLYALRDVTATVPSIPLIASSIMSKKLASGSDVIVLDVKVGEGAFMKTKEEAKELSKIMVEIGKSFNREVVACITNMSQPLGQAVGNKLEVVEAMNTLQGNGPKDLETLCLELGAQMIHKAQLADSVDQAKEILLESLHNGKAFAKFKEFIEAQGGEVPNVDAFINTKQIIDIPADTDGFIHNLHALTIGLSAMKLGAGRSTKDDKIDYDVGIVLHKKVGDKVAKGDTLATIYTNHKNNEEVIHDVKDAFTIQKEGLDSASIVYDIIT